MTIAATAGGVRVHVLSAGEGEPVILLHGLGASSYSWRHILPTLGPDRRVLAPDFPGFGRSEQPWDFDYTVDGFTLWLFAFMDSLSIERAALVGNSMGGMVALSAAMARPDRVSRLALINVPVYVENRPRYLWPLRWPVIGSIFESCMGPAAVRLIAATAFADRSVITEELVREYSLALSTKAGRRAVAQFIRNAIPPDVDERIRRYPEVRTPTLVILGDRDIMVPVASAERFVRSLPHSKLIVIPFCGHAPQEEKPEAVLPALLDFLSV
ncbi:MAG: alpha/beta hydrolase [Elusimicrobia bacterium]|nr:alpha/beta hydrolase [Elusimicrobiota bacterium]